MKFKIVELNSTKIKTNQPTKIKQTECPENTVPVLFILNLAYKALVISNWLGHLVILRVQVTLFQSSKLFSVK